jgi:S-adenosylmethionine uptake transporter
MPPPLPAPAIRALLAACLGIALFACMDAAMKGLSVAMGAYSAMFWRCVAGTAVAGVPWLATRPRRPPAAALKLHLWRGMVTAAMAVCFFWGLARTPMAQAIALTFIAPLIALYLSAVLLGETVPRSAILGSLLALAGVGIIIAGQAAVARGPEAWGGTGAILVSAVCYAYNLVLQRKQAQAAGPVEVAFFQSLSIACVLGVAAPVVGLAPPAGHWPMLVLSATLASVSLVLLSWAYARAEASYLVPVEYSAFLWAALIGWAVFGEAVRPATLAGAALIVAGCVYAARNRPAPVAEGAL